MKTLPALVLLIPAPLHAAEAEPPDWKELVAAGKRHAMRFPPAQAELVLVHTETWSVLGNRTQRPKPGGVSRVGSVVSDRIKGFLRVAE